LTIKVINLGNNGNNNKRWSFVIIIKKDLELSSDLRTQIPNSLHRSNELTPHPPLYFVQRVCCLFIFINFTLDETYLNSITNDKM